MSTWWLAPALLEPGQDGYVRRVVGATNDLPVPAELWRSVDSVGWPEVELAVPFEPMGPSLPQPRLSAELSGPSLPQLRLAQLPVGDAGRTSCSLLCATCPAPSQALWCAEGPGGDLYSVRPEGQFPAATRRAVHEGSGPAGSGVLLRAGYRAVVRLRRSGAGGAPLAWVEVDRAAAEALCPGRW